MMLMLTQDSSKPPVYQITLVGYHCKGPSHLTPFLVIRSISSVACPTSFLSSVSVSPAA